MAHNPLSDAALSLGDTAMESLFQIAVIVVLFSLWPLLLSWPGLASVVWLGSVFATVGLMIWRWWKGRNPIPQVYKQPQP